MLGAYGWAFAKPIRKLYYNLTVTAVSAVAAFAIGGVQLVGLANEHLRLPGEQTGEFLSERSETVGAAMVVLFALCWMYSALLHRYRAASDHKASVGRYPSDQIRHPASAASKEQLSSQ
jgi:high-affinity nickel-transport protein